MLGAGNRLGVLDINIAVTFYRFTFLKKPKKRFYKVKIVKICDKFKTICGFLLTTSS